MIALASAHAGAVIALLLQQGPWWVTSALIAIVLASASVSVHRYAGGGRVRELLLRADGGFEVLTAAGGEAAVLTYVSVAEPWLTVFGVRAASGRRHDILLLRDNVEEEPFRRLRVRLRESRRTGSAGASVASGGGAPADPADPEPRRSRRKGTRSRADTP